LKDFYANLIQKIKKVGENFLIICFLFFSEKPLYKNLKNIRFGVPVNCRNEKIIRILVAVCLGESEKPQITIS
jgi:hypothetical protein